MNTVDGWLQLQLVDDEIFSENLYILTIPSEVAILDFYMISGLLVSQMYILHMYIWQEDRIF